jgi:bifunctional DNA-binding transcriptional regulator/antitoxin component of YhaV-PrlF toxin-antitoxin module
MAEEVKRPRRRGFTRISPKHQVTLPSEMLVRAGLRTGDQLRVEAGGPGEIRLVRISDALDRHAGTMRGVFPPGTVDELRREWE